MEDRAYIFDDIERIRIPCFVNAKRKNDYVCVQ